MNIWLVTSEFPPDYPGGGIATYCIEFASALSRRGHQITVFTCAADGQSHVSEDRYEDLFPVVRVPAWTATRLDHSMGHWARFSYAIAESIRARLEAAPLQRPDAIEVQDYGAVGYFLQKRKLLGDPSLAGIPILVMCHTPLFEIAKVNEYPSFKFPLYWTGRTEKFSILSADQAISPSDFLASTLEQELGRRPITLPLPYKLPQLEVTDASRSEKSFDLIYVGRLEIRKGVLQLLEGLRRFWDAGRPIRLHMVGGDTTWVAKNISVRSYVLQKYSRYIERGLIKLTLMVERAALPGMLGDAKALVVPSLYENFPYVCIEGMAHGLPVIASSAGGQSEMVGGSARECGFVFSWGQDGSFEAAVENLLKRSDQERQALSEAARDRIRQLCDPDAYVDERVRMLGELNFTANSPIEYPFLNRILPSEQGRLPVYQPPAKDVGERGLVSVVVPFFNLGAYLPATLSSICDSTYSKIEIIIVDDGSNEPASLEVLREVKTGTWRFPIHVKTIENAGLANARNVGAHIARGEYLAFIDADDTVEGAYYDRCVSVLAKYSNASFVYSWVRYFGESEATWVTFDTDLPYLLGSNMLAAFLVTRRNDYLEHGQNDRAMSYGLEDYEAWLRMVSNGCLGISIPEALSNYRVRGQSMTRSTTMHNQIQLRERAAGLNRSVYATWGEELFQLMNANGPGWLWNSPSLDYPPLGYMSDGVSQSRLGSLRFKFTPEQVGELASTLEEPAVSWLVGAVVRRNLHKPLVGVAKSLLGLRKMFSINRKST